MYSLIELKQIRIDILNQIKWESNGEEQIRLHICLDEIDRSILRILKEQQ